MTENSKHWEMTNIRFGFIVYEKCYQTGELRTYFSVEDNPILGDRYREGKKHWTRVENAQSFQFDLLNRETGNTIKFDDLMGLLYCTECREECELFKLQKKHEAEKTMVIVAFGFFPQAIKNPVPQEKLDVLTDYFNQRRDTTRSKIKVLPFNLIDDLSRCRGEFLHDVDMLSKEPPPKERRRLF